MTSLDSWLGDASRRFRIGAACLCFLVIGYAEYALLADETTDVEAIGRKSRIVREFGEGLPVAQTFTMTRDGLEAMSVLVWTSRPASLWVTCELLQRIDASSATLEPIYRSTTRIETGSGAQWRTIRFAPVASSINRVYEVRLQLRRVEEPAGGIPGDQGERPQVGLMAWADNPLRFATMIVDGQERWDDLAFSVRGAGRTRYERLRLAVAPSLSPLLLRPSVQLVLLLTFNLVLAAVAFGALSDVESAGPPAARDELHGASVGRGVERSQGRWTRFVAATVTTVGLCGALAWAVHHNSEEVVVDLIGELDSAVMESPRGLHGAFDLVEDAINGRRLPAIFAHPTSRIAWNIDVPPHGTLRTFVTLVSGIWEQPGDGVFFRVGISDGDRYREVFGRQVNPRENLPDRAWIPVDVDLSAYAGRRIAIVFETLPGPLNDSSYDWALWGSPRIVVTR